MSVTVLLLLGLLVGCATRAPELCVTPTPDTHHLLEEDTDAPSFEKLHQRYFEPHWM
jgi:hypothetical protein